MKHVIISPIIWSFSTERSAYETRNWGGDDNISLPVHGVIPTPIYTVTVPAFSKCGQPHREVYRGTKKHAAEAIKKLHEKGQQGIFSGVTCAYLCTSIPMLPENQFQITTKENKVVVIPGEDHSNRCLMFVGHSSHKENNVLLLREGTTAEILLRMWAKERFYSSHRMEVVALMEAGQKVSFYVERGHSSKVYSVTWTGETYLENEVSSKVWCDRGLSLEYL